LDIHPGEYISLGKIGGADIQSAVLEQNLMRLWFPAR
jgi:hypothetical protein